MSAQAVRLSNVDIDNALRNRHFEVLFQPIFDLGNGALARVETFVRWRHPSLGVLPPGAFISFFESQGRMSELTRYVLDQALSEYRDWRGPSAPGFSINLALSDLSDEAFTSHFEVALRDKGFPPDLITLECPMPPVTMAVEVAAEHFRRLRQTGARLAIEVRGRANDFLRTIEPFPFDEIKTGGAAILRFARTVRGPGLSAISELLEIANKSNAAITAVGVEDQASLSALRGLGFAAAQGNHLSKVGPLSAFTPSRVNEVRTLLGLDPLSNQDLHALFRTEAPAPAPSSTVPPHVESHLTDDTLVERLAARMAGQTEEAKPDRAAAKAEAIKRAKQKKAAARIAANAKLAETTAARNLQERLSQEFEDAAFAPDSGFAQTAHQPEQETAPVEDFESSADLEMPEQKSHEAASVEPAAIVDAEDVSATANDFAQAEVEEAVVAKAREQMTAFQQVRASLAVGGARAYFRPGFRVGIVREKPEAPATPVDGIAEAPPLREAAPLPAAQLQAAPQSSSPIESPTEIAASAGSEAASMQETDYVAEASAVATASAPIRRRKQSFLTRKYRVWPTHFWPRSWKRSWRRREVALARRRLESEAAE